MPNQLAQSISDKISMLCTFCVLPDCNENSKMCIYSNGLQSYKRTHSRNRKHASRKYWQSKEKIWTDIIRSNTKLCQK